MATCPIYLDNAATTKPSPEVCKTVAGVMREQYGNPSSLHGKGLEAERVVDEARGIIAGALGAEPGNVFFTSGGTESNNLAILGACLRGPRGSADRIVTTALENPSVLKPLKEAESRGWRVTYLSTDGSGILDPCVLEASLNEQVALITLAHVNNETGAILPLEAVGALRNRICPGALLHIDCAQSFAKLPVSPVRYGTDLVSVSAHKIHGPKGAGALYISGRARLSPIVHGGGQERGMRSGTENTPAIAGFGAAVREAAASVEGNADHVRALRQKLFELLGGPGGVANMPVSGGDGYSPYILTLSFPGIPAELMLNLLDREGVYVSSGAACSSRRASKTGSHVLAAMGLEPEIIKGAIRFSFSRYNTMAEIEITADKIKNAARQRRK